MKALLFGLLFLLLYNFPIYSQWGSYESAIGGGIILSIPTGDFSNEADLGYGFKAKYIYMFSSNLGLMAEAGYLTWGEKTFSSFGFDNTYNSSSFLFNVGFKLNFIPDEVGPYMLALAGGHFFNTERKFSGPFSTTTPDIIYSWSTSSSDNQFSISGGFGYEFDLDADLFLDTSINYSYITDNEIGYMGINLGLNFGLF